MAAWRVASVGRSVPVALAAYFMVAGWAGCTSSSSTTNNDDDAQEAGAGGDEQVSAGASGSAGTQGGNSGAGGGFVGGGTGGGSAGTNGGSAEAGGGAVSGDAGAGDGGEFAGGEGGTAGQGPEATCVPNEAVCEVRRDASDAQMGLVTTTALSARARSRASMVRAKITNAIRACRSARERSSENAPRAACPRAKWRRVRAVSIAIQRALSARRASVLRAHRAATGIARPNAMRTAVVMLPAEPLVPTGDVRAACLLSRAGLLSRSTGSALCRKRTELQHHQHLYESGLHRCGRKRELRGGVRARADTLFGQLLSDMQRDRSMGSRYCL